MRKRLTKQCGKKCEHYEEVNKVPICNYSPGGGNRVKFLVKPVGKKKSCNLIDKEERGGKKRDSAVREDNTVSVDAFHGDPIVVG